MSKIKNFFCAGTLRSGGTLLSNLLSTHKDVILIIDQIRFFRYIYQKYNPIKKSSQLYKLCGELSLRLKTRDNITIKKELFLKKIKKNKATTYSEVYSSIFDAIKTKFPKKKIIGEYEGGHWRNINDFLKFNKNNVSIHMIRDPRAMLSSWKKITFSKGYKYFNSIFNWIDSADHYLKYKKIFSKRKYLLIKFEELQKEPEKYSRKLCKFLNISFDKNMTQTKKWKKLLKSRYNFINITAYDKKEKVYGFSTERIDKWKKHLEDWEVNLINYLCQKRLKKLNYDFEKIDKNLLKKGIKILNKDSFLKERYLEFVKKNKGNDMSLNDPTNPKNWESKLKPGIKFINTNEFSVYKEELKKIKNEVNNLDK
jgi:hypothetical protein